MPLKLTPTQIASGGYLKFKGRSLIVASGLQLIENFDPEEPPQGQAAAPTFSPVAGTYTGSQTVTITTTTAGATIKYSLDGSVPSITYSAPVVIATSATLRALAQATGLTDSDITQAIYTIGVVSTGNKWMATRKTSADIEEDRRRTIGTNPAEATFRAQFKDQNSNAPHFYGLSQKDGTGKSIANFLSKTNNGAVPVTSSTSTTYVPDLVMNDGNYNKAYFGYYGPNDKVNGVLQQPQRNFSYIGLAENSVREIVDAAWYGWKNKNHDLKVRVRNVLMAVAARPHIQATNQVLFPLTEPALLPMVHAFWPLHFAFENYLTSYEYSRILEPGEAAVYSTSDKATLDTMFKAQAAFYDKACNKNLKGAFPQRETKQPEDYTELGAFHSFKRLMIGKTAATDDSNFSSGMRYMGNKEWSGLNLIMSVGILYNIKSYIDECYHCFRETILYSYTKWGFGCEFWRGSGEAEIGGAYQGTQISHMVAVAEKAARIGDFRFYNYTTHKGWQDDSKGVNTKSDGVNPKGLLFILKQHARLHTDPNFEWYASLDANAGSRRGQLLHRVDGKYKSTTTDGWRSGHIKAAIAIANKYYKDATLAAYLNSPPYAQDQAYGSGSFSSDHLGFGSNNSAVVEDWLKEGAWNTTTNRNCYHGLNGNVIDGVPIIT